MSVKSSPPFYYLAAACGAVLGFGAVMGIASPQAQGTLEPLPSPAVHRPLAAEVRTPETRYVEPTACISLGHDEAVQELLGGFGICAH
jgi:hypothetical protein